MTAPARSEYLELADYLGPLRRRWPTVFLLACIGVVLAAGYYLAAPRVYTGTVLVQVNALPTTANAVGGRTNGAVNMDNEAQFVQSAVVVTTAASKLPGTPQVTSLIKDIHVAVPPNTTFLQISCGEPNRGLAQLCANAVGRAYLFNRRVSFLNQTDNLIAAFDREAGSLQGDIQAKQLALNGRLSTRARVLDKLQLSAKQAQLNTVEGHINTLTPLKASLQQNSNLVGAIVTPAPRPGSPTSPRALLVGPSGLAAGLVIGLILAYARDRRRPRVHAAGDVQRRFDLPALVNLDMRKAGPAGSLASPRSTAGQAFTELAQYVARTLGNGSHVVLVAGTSAGSGGSVVAANLAVALARTRGKTVLLCADLRRTRIPQLLSVGDGRGLAELLSGTAAVSEALRHAPDADRLNVITPGRDVGSVLYTMDYDRASELLAELQQASRYVVIEVRCHGDGDGTFGLAEFADAAIVVAELGTSRVSDVADCLHRLDRLQTTVLGAAVLPGGRAVKPIATPAAASRPGKRQELPPAGPAASQRRRTQPPAGQRQPTEAAASQRQAASPKPENIWPAPGSRSGAPADAGTRGSEPASRPAPGHGGTATAATPPAVATPTGPAGNGAAVPDPASAADRAEPGETPTAKRTDASPGARPTGKTSGDTLEFDSVPSHRPIAGRWPQPLVEAAGTEPTAEKEDSYSESADRVTGS